MEARLFPEGTVPEWATPEWYAGREAAPHLEQEGHQQRLLTSSHFVQQALVGHPQATVVDLGAGDGGLLSTLPPTVTRWGYDLQQSNVDAAVKRGEDVRLLDVVADSARVEWGDIVVATEMLEHLVDPHALVREVYDVGVTTLVASSPYTETADAHYDYHLWAWDERGYRRMLTDAGWKIVAVGRAWICQVVLAER